MRIRCVRELIRLPVALVVGALLLSQSPLSHAALLTFAYEGTVNSTSGGAAFDAFSGLPLRIEYTFDSTTGPFPFNPAPLPNSGTFFSGTITGITATVGGNTFTGSGGFIRIQNNSHMALGNVGLTGNVGGLDLVYIQQYLGSGSTGLSGLPTTALEAMNPDALLRLGFVTGGSAGLIQATGNIQNVTAVIPIPSTFLLMGSGLVAGLAAWRWKQKKGRPSLD